MLEETLVLFKNVRQPGYSGDLASYQSSGGYSALKKALKMKPEEIVNTVKESNLRGRGGAGFPTGLKWSFMAKGTGKPSYLVINADEGEPGTFKDREIMLKEPHMFLEGYMIGCYAIGCHHGYIYVRGEFVPAMQRLQEAIDECYQSGLLGDKIAGSDFKLDITLHPGAGAYICGEETALLDSLEGRRGQPRTKPPFPAVAGFNGCPTSVNNVETLMNVPSIINDGAEAFKELGPPNNAGTHLVSLSGHVNNPGVYELKMGVNLKDIIYDIGGGILGGKELKGVIPGGSSTPVLRPDEIDIPYDFDSLAKAKSMMGSSAIIVFNEDTDVVKFLYRIVKFYNHESCGQCTPCREGTNWSRLMLRQFVQQQGTPQQLKRLYRVGGNMMGTTLCPLGDACAMPLRAFLEKYPEEFQAHFAEAS
ncbi:MAG: NADH-quinone oxidoreductase subunit NuoF [SAR324 cluster bacterium]|nr:NADH-quinone oxidoreductase subunit NuoF [SAR324 cluster bacterium]